MSTLAGVFATTHSPTCYLPAERWNEVRASRTLRADVPMDDLEENRRKKARVEKGFAVLKQKLAAVAPDVLVVFGDDQLECFDFTNQPSFAVYVGESFEGPISTGERKKLRGHPGLAVALVTGLMRRGFDPAFCADMPKPERGVGHAFFRPAESLTDFQTPLVPVFVNCYYAPQPTAMRCYRLGTAVREIIAEQPGDLRVAVVGSGGLWHTPRATDAYLDEAFDRTMLRYLTAGDVKGMAQYFDAYEIPAGDRSQDIRTRGRGVTGMPGPGGPQGGTRETCNWIAAAAVADGKPATVVDYVPVYASPIGAAFAYWPDV